jgi:hypothetical protein
MKIRAWGSAGFLSFLLRCPCERSAFFPPLVKGGQGGGWGRKPLKSGSGSRRNREVIFKRLPGRLTNFLDSEANEGDINALSGPCVPTPPDPPSQGGEMKTPRATKTRGWQRLPYP